MPSQTYVTLQTGAKMPLIGYGTWQKTWYDLVEKKGRSFVEGRLRFKFYAVRRNYLLCGLIPRSSIIQEEESDEEFLNEDEDDNFLWLTNNSEPWIDVLSKWSLCRPVRAKFYLKCSSILQYVSKFPALKRTDGIELAQEGELEAPLHAALEAGYRHIDTAAAYENEHIVGKVLKQWIDSGKLKREDLFIVTKLPPTGIRAGPGGPSKWLRSSLEKLGLDYVDLYLVHVPFGGKVDPNNPDAPFPIGANGKMAVESDTDHVAVWKDMEAEVRAGRAKAIGLSNYNKRMIQLVLDNCSIKPANLQVELHVYMQQRPLVDFCRQNGITVCAYSPIGTPGSATFFQRFGANVQLPALLKNPTIVEVAIKYKKQPGQVLLKHIVQRGIVAIPKSLSKERIEQNIALFDWELSRDDMAKIDALDQGAAGRILNMTFVGIDSSHPAFPFNEYP